MIRPILVLGQVTCSQACGNRGSSFRKQVDEDDGAFGMFERVWRFDVVDWDWSANDRKRFSNPGGMLEITFDGLKLIVSGRPDP